ncbi:MAG: IS630 family transposase [Gammaproteobacteria bacterium]
MGRITAEYRERMYDVLALYGKPYDPQEPVICLDEKSKQLLAQTRPPLPASPGHLAKEDYEYRRAGTRNLFVAVEPKGGRRAVEVTRRRTKLDFVSFVQRLVNGVYASARTIHLVLDNLNTHFRSSFEQVLGVAGARQLLARIEFHYTPKHASWLNMAEIEIGILDRQCLGRRMGSDDHLKTEVGAWEQRRNGAGCRIEWTFTRQDADQKLARHYVT